MGAAIQEGGECPRGASATPRGRGRKGPLRGRARPRLASALPGGPKGIWSSLATHRRFSSSKLRMSRGRRLSLSLFFFLLRPIILRPGWRGSCSPKALPGVAFLAFRRSSQRYSAVPLIKPSLLKGPHQPVSPPLPCGCYRQVPAPRLPTDCFSSTSNGGSVVLRSQCRATYLTHNRRSIQSYY